MINSLASESKVLGAIFNNIDYIIEFPELNMNYFSSPANREIYSLLKGFYTHGVRTFDVLDIYAKSEVYKGCRESIDAVGGLDYLNVLQEIAKDDDFETTKMHVKSVVDASFKNDLVKAMDKAADKIENDNSLDSNKVDALVDSAITSVRAKYSGVNQVQRLGEKVDELWFQIEKERKGGTLGIKTFSPALDRYFTYQRGELVVLGARAKAGKSMYVVNEVYRLAVEQGIPTAIFDTELPSKTFLIRLVSRHTGIAMQDLMSGKYIGDTENEKLIKTAMEEIKDAPIFHHYDPYWTKEAVTARAKKLRIQEKIQIIFYDYIKAPEVVANGVAEHSELGNWTIHLKNLAGELNIPVVALAQMSPYKEGGLRLADSRKIERYASTIVYLVRKTSEQWARDGNDLGGNYYLFVAFNRNGEQMPEENQDRGINVDFFHSHCLLKEAFQQTLTLPSL